MDIKFSQDGYNFNIRSSCIIKDKNHKNIILTNMRAVDGAFILPGGRLQYLENSYEAIRREIEEELGIILDYKLIAVEEIIVDDIKFHMIEFVFYAELDNFDKIRNINDGWDKFKIVKISEIDNYDIRTKTIKELIKQENYTEIIHNIHYDWAEIKNTEEL